MLINNIAFLVLGLLSFPLYILLTKKINLSKDEWNNKLKELADLKTEKAVLESNLNNKTLESNLLTNKLKLLEDSAYQINLEFERAKALGELSAKQMQELKSQLELSIRENKELSFYTQNIRIENEQIKEQLKLEKEKYSDQKQELEQMGEKLEITFRNLANSILEERSQKFDEHQKTSLKHILEPFQKDIETMKKDFNEKFTKESTEILSLGLHIKNMMEMSNQISDQANHLTQALRGQVKQQGNWGEAILESILEFAGLQKGVQYFVQEFTQTSEGNRIQPDVRVQYPDNRHIIIDSKVTMVHYERYSYADQKEEQERHLQSLIGSMKSHINDLSSKNYQNSYSNTLDFVMMFIPVEGAFITAMQYDRELWQYAYNKRILLISPTNLIAAMKLVQDFWQKDKNHKNSEEIASKAASLYEKLVGFLETFEKIGDTLQKAEQSFQEAKRHLSTGRGNLISKAEQMKRFNQLKTSKSLPKDLTNNALFEDGFVTEKEIEN